MEQQPVDVNKRATLFSRRVSRWVLDIEVVPRESRIVETSGQAVNKSALVDIEVATAEKGEDKSEIRDEVNPTFWEKCVGSQNGGDWDKNNEVMVTQDGRRKAKISGWVGVSESDTLVGWDTVPVFVPGRW